MSRLANRRALLASGLAAAVFAASGAPVTAAPRRGGVLRAALPTAGGLFGAAATLARAETLTEIGPDGSLHAGLATAWEPSEGARVWDIAIRPEVRFPDGSTLGGAEVIGALAPLAADLSLVAPLQVRLALASPDPDLPLRLSGAEFAVIVDGRGTGLYEQVEHVPGELFVGRRVPRHWRDGKAGWFDRVELIGLDPAEARLAALRRGRVDIGAGLGAHAEGVLRAGGDHVVEVTEDGLVALGRAIGRSPGAGLDQARFAERWWRV